MPYDKNIEDIIIEAIRNGSAINNACETAGIAPATFFDWTSEKSPRFKLEFSEKYKEARAEWKTNSAIQCVNALHKRAIGYEYTETIKRADEEGNLEIVEERTKMIHSDTAAIFLITNHDRDNYQQRNVIESNLTGKLDVNNFDIEISKEEKEDYKKQIGLFLNPGNKSDKEENENNQINE